MNKSPESLYLPNSTEKINLIDLVIDSKNLQIIPISLEYRFDIFREFTKEITIYMFPQEFKNINETDNFIMKSQIGLVMWSQFFIVILDKWTQEFLGWGWLFNINTKTPEFGIWIKKSAHGNGYGKEAILALKEWADKNLDYEYLLYPVARENIASRRIPEAMGGFVFREYRDFNAVGVEQDTVEYRMYPNK